MSIKNQKRTRRQVLAFPCDGKDEDGDGNSDGDCRDTNDFEIDEDDYHTVRKLLLESGIQQMTNEIQWTKRVRKIANGEERRVHAPVAQNKVEIQIQENDEERRVCVFHMASIDVMSLSACIGRLNNLTYLNLKNSSIMSIPPSIGHLTSLKELDLSITVNLLNLPEEIGDLADLKVLNLSSSMIDSLPRSIGRLMNLEELALSHTLNLATLPEEIGDLGSLKCLRLAFLSIKSLPPSIGRLTNLQDLDISGTRRLSTLPEEIGDLSSLKHLRLGSSNVTSLPPSIGRLANLQDLDISVTRELSTLPKEIGDLASLSCLRLGSSDIITSLPASIGRLTNLQELDLSSTSSLSTIPKEIGNLASLKNLNLRDSGVTSLPSSIGRLTNLRGLHLSFAYKLPRLPDEIGGLANLNTLFLEGSGITLLPPSIGRLKNLHELSLSCENLKSLGLPEEILNLTNNSPCSLVGVKLIGDGFDDNRMAQKLLYAMTRNIAISRIGIAIGSETTDEEFGSQSFPMPLTTKMWPLVLHNAKGAFAEPRPNRNYYSYFRDIRQPDAIYQLLVDGRESFVRVLVNRYCEPKNATRRSNRDEGDDSSTIRGNRS